LAVGQEVSSARARSARGRSVRARRTSKAAWVLALGAIRRASAIYRDGRRDPVEPSAWPWSVTRRRGLAMADLYHRAAAINSVVAVAWP
jgi:hypothetical protein